jgi:hypothetical protein
MQRLGSSIQSSRISEIVFRELLSSMKIPDNYSNNVYPWYSHCFITSP